MTTHLHRTPTDIAAAVRATPSRHRDLFLVAAVWTHGFTAFRTRLPRRARRPAAAVSYPLWLLAAAAYRPTTVLLRPAAPDLRGGAALVIRTPLSASRPGLLLAVLGLLVAAVGTDIALTASTPTAVGWMVTAGLVALVLALLLMARSSVRDAVRTLRGRQHATPHPAADVEIGNVAAHPRGAQLGTQLINRLLAELDRDGLGAQLDASSVAVAAWYSDLGFLSAPRYPHSLHVYRPPAPGPTWPHTCQSASSIHGHHVHCSCPSPSAGDDVPRVSPADW